MYPRLDDFLAKGYEMRDMDTGEPIAPIRRAYRANAYIGAFRWPRRWRRGERGDRGPLHRYRARAGADGSPLRLVARRFRQTGRGTIAGHIIECGAQCTGGNCQVDWETIPDMANIGYPIVEAEPDGSFVVTKHPAAGGRVSLDSVKEQLLYELGDPKHYITPDCVADFTSVQLAADGPDRVRVKGIRGGPRPPTLKLSISYANGWKAIGTLVYSWPQALAKARAADRIVRQRLESLGLHFEEIHTEFFGVNACHGRWPRPIRSPEVQLRIGVRGQDKSPWIASHAS